MLWLRRLLFLSICFVGTLWSVPLRAAPAAPATFHFEAEPLETRWSWRGAVAWSGDGEIRVALGWKDARNATFLQLQREKSRVSGVLTRLSNGHSSQLASFPLGAKGEIGLQKVGNRLRVLWNGALVAATETALAGHQFGLAVSGKVKIESASPQPTENVVFRDDFMRAPQAQDGTAQGEWSVAGIWNLSGALGPQSDAALSPNPFVFRAEGAKPNQARAGKWWWSDYSVAVSLRATRSEENAPLVAAVEAFCDANGRGVRGEIDFARGVARLKNGDKILAQSAPFDTETAQWHRVRLEPGPGVAKLWVDGILRVVASSKLAQGGVALRALAGGGGFVDFDDVRVGSSQAEQEWGEGALPERFQKDRLMRNWAADASAWTRDASGTWWHTGDFFRAPSVELPFHSPAPGQGVALRFWADPQKPNTGVKMVIERPDASSVLRFTLWQDGQKVGQQSLAASDQVSGLRFRFAPDKVPQFRLGVQMGANFTNFIFPARRGAGAASGLKVGIQPLRNGQPLPPPQLQKISLLSPTSALEGRAIIGVDITSVSPEIARLNGLPDAAGAIVDDVEAGSPAQAVGVRAGDVIRGVDGARVSDVETMRAAVGAVKAPAPVTLEILRPQDDESGLDWAKCRVSTREMLDYAFTSAPVDWRAARGTWDVAERWTCSPQWSFFAGQNDIAPLLWSRFATRGDWTLEAYLATPMDGTRPDRSPADLNLSVGGDGAELASGYSFIFAGRNQSVNQIRRGDAVVWAKPFEAPPGAGETHQDWFYVRLEKRQTAAGARFRWSVNGREVATYLDPKPLPDGGHLGFWTQNGALSIARVRLWHSGLRAPQEIASRPMAAGSSPLELRNSLGNWSARGQGREASARLVLLSPTSSAGQKAALQITNPRSGGDWTTFVTRAPFSPASRPILAWDYRIPSGVKINLYALVEDSWREIVWSGGASSGEASAEPLGNVGGLMSDGQWHHARFDLLGALREKGLEVSEVKALAFAAPDRDYLRAGLGGNRRGATYWLRDFKAGP